MQDDLYTCRRPEDFNAISDDEDSTQSMDTEDQSGEELRMFSDSDIPALTSGDAGDDD